MSQGQRTPPNAQLNTWYSDEVMGLVYIWHHASGGAPQWRLPRTVAEERNWPVHGRSEHHIAVHCQEIPENGADVAHLKILHKPLIGLPKALWFMGHLFDAVWEPGLPDSPHLSSCLLYTSDAADE